MKRNVRKANEFHNIRSRELQREKECLKGAPTLGPTAIPAYFTPSLKEICAKTIAETFETQDRVDALKDDPDTYELYRLVIDQLSTDLKLEEIVRRVNEQDYWRACCESRWSLGQLTEFTKTKKLEPPVGGWKQVYLERHLEEYLMKLECQPPVEEGKEDAAADAISHQIVHLCTVCGNWIRCLNLTHQGYHFNIELLASKLPGLEELTLTYGVLNAGIGFKMDMMKMKQQDAMWLQGVLRSSTSLHTLNLPGNGIDGELLRALVAGLVNNNKVTSLDLSHNRIDDDGAAALGILLMKKNYGLEVLKLNDNVIREAGARALGRALPVNTKLRELNLKLNRLGDIGGQYIVDGLKSNESITSLNLGSNELAAESARALGEALKVNRTLLELDIAGNTLQEDGGRVILTAVENNSSLVKVDVRFSGVDIREEEAIAKVVQRRVAQQQAERLEGVEKEMTVKIQKKVADRILKTHGVTTSL